MVSAGLAASGSSRPIEFAPVLANQIPPSSPCHTPTGALTRGESTMASVDAGSGAVGSMLTRVSGPRTVNQIPPEPSAAHARASTMVGGPAISSIVAAGSRAHGSKRAIVWLLELTHHRRGSAAGKMAAGRLIPLPRTIAIVPPGSFASGSIQPRASAPRRAEPDPPIGRELDRDRFTHTGRGERL